MGRITKPLTDTEIKKAKAKDKDYKLTDGYGLYILVKKNGVKSWRYDFTYLKKRKTLTIGNYPLISLKEARIRHTEAKTLLLNGHNPIEIKKNKKTTDSLTFGEIIDDWFEKMITDKMKEKDFSYEEASKHSTIVSYRTTLKHAIKNLGNKPLKDTDSFSIINLLVDINKNTVETAHRLYTLLDKVFKRALSMGYIAINPMNSIDKPQILSKRIVNHYPAVVNEVEIKELLHDIWVELEKNFKSDYSTIKIFKLIPYVFVRSANIRNMEWNEIDFENECWRISAKKMKMPHEFIFPLPKQAIKILKEIETYSRHRSKYVFPSLYSNDRAVVSGTLSQNLNKLGYENKHCMHGFRSMFSTICNIYSKEHKEDSKIIEACIAHREKNTVKAAYDRSYPFKYIDEKRKLIQWYADWLDELYLTTN